MLDIDKLLSDEPSMWIQDLPAFQRDAIEKLLAGGLSYDAVAEAWVSASAENTFRLAASTIGDNGSFLSNLKYEVRNFLCGDKKYNKERTCLFGEKGLARTLVVSTLAVAIAPHIGVASAVLAPLIALILASMGKITLNAWCATEKEK